MTTSNGGLALDLGPQFRGDSAFTKRMRRHQSWYRAHVLGVPYGTGPKSGSKTSFGNMLTPADASRGLNFLTDDIFVLAKERIARQSHGVEPFRLLHNMLSSQPMCFNLFAPLARDLSLAADLLQAIDGLEVAKVLAVRLEYAPEPQAEYLDDLTSFDAFIEYKKKDGSLAFLGIETKLTEHFSAKHYDRPEYRRWMFGAASPWRAAAHGDVSAVRHNQLWRDHLLTIAVRDHVRSKYENGTFMLIRHRDDRDCAALVRGYERLLEPRDATFLDMPLDELIARWQRVVPRKSARWLSAFRQRYLALDAGAAVANDRW